MSLKKKEILFGFFEGLLQNKNIQSSCFKIENETTFSLKLFFFLKQLHVSINEWHGSWRGPKEIREGNRGHEEVDAVALS